MAACSVVSHSAQDRQDIVPVPVPPDQWNNTIKDSISHAHTVSQHPSPATHKTIKQQEKNVQSQNTDSQTKFPESNDSLVLQDSINSETFTLRDTTNIGQPEAEPDSLQAKPLFNDIVSYKADDSI